MGGGGKGEATAPWGPSPGRVAGAGSHAPLLGGVRGCGMSLYVGVAGASRPEPRLLDQAEVLGRRLAEAGAIVVCGGGPG